MNPFLVVVDLGEATLGLDALSSGLPALSQSDGRVEVLWSGAWAGAWVPSRHLARPAFIHQHGIYAIGNVRLTGRKSRRSGVDRVVDDLAFIIDEYRRQGPLAVRDLIGDFAFVLWDSHQRQLLAARDALGVKTLFWQQRGERLYVSSHSDCLEASSYDQDFIAHFLVGLPSPTDRTIHAGIHRLLPGSVLTSDAGKVSTRPYWSPLEFVSANRVIDEAEAVSEWRRLFFEAVEAQLDDEVPAYSQLSGGLDSSAVVSVAQVLAREGRIKSLVGTVTAVDSLSDGDERKYSDAVLAEYPLPNGKLVDYWAWQPDDIGPPQLGEPRIFLPFYARSRAQNDLVRAGGARVLLSGYGSDQYLGGPSVFIADLVTQGRFQEAGRHLMELAITNRRSFYDMAFRNAIQPLMPRWLQRRWIEPGMTVPEWIDPVKSRQYGLTDRLAFPEDRSLGCGVFGQTMVKELGTIDLTIERGISEEGQEHRYPFLHRPLVEFCLSLPPDLRIRPQRKKFVLRKALADVLPPLVRDRQGKGGIDGRLVWSLNKEQALLDRLVDHSHLVEMGWVDPGILRSSLAANRAGNTVSAGSAIVTLALETWLAVRSGRWSRRVSVGTAANTAANISPLGA